MILNKYAHCIVVVAVSFFVTSQVSAMPFLYYKDHRTNSGYGLLGNISEADARFAMDIPCGQSREILGVDEKSCKLEGQPPKLNDVTTITAQMYEKSVTNDVRRHYLEHLSLQAQAILPMMADKFTVSKKSSIYACLGDENLSSPEIKNINNAKKVKFEADTYELENSGGTFDPYRVKVVREQLSEENILQALFEAKFLENYWIGYDCETQIKDKNPNCLGYMKYIQKLKNNYPLLYQESSDGKNVLKQELNEIFSETQKLLGKSSDKSNLGKNTVEAFLFSVDKFTEIKNTHSSLPASSISGPDILYELVSKENNSEQYMKIASIIKKQKLEYAKKLEREINGICNVSLNDIYKKDRTAIEQTLIDLSGFHSDLKAGTKHIANVVLCTIPEYENRKQNDCQKWLYSKKVENTRSIHGSMNDQPPLGSSIEYKIIDNGIKKTIALDVGFQFDANISEKARKKFIENAQKCANDFYKEKMKKLDINNVDFKFNFGEDKSSSFTPSKNIKISECYCSGCADLESYTSCKNKSGNEAKKRADSEHFYIDISCSSISHEMGHRLSLPDEYPDPLYPFMDIGQKNSYMRSGDDILRRQIEQMLNPPVCKENIF